MAAGEDGPWSDEDDVVVADVEDDEEEEEPWRGQQDENPVL